MVRSPESGSRYTKCLSSAYSYHLKLRATPMQSACGQFLILQNVFSIFCSDLCITRITIFSIAIINRQLFLPSSSPRFLFPLLEGTALFTSFISSSAASTCLIRMVNLIRASISRLIDAGNLRATFIPRDELAGYLEVQDGKIRMRPNSCPLPIANALC